jgi:ATP-dependent DNA ligase
VPCWATVPAFDDGEALWAVVTEQRLEGVVAKPLDSPYLPGDRRRWVKTKSAAWPRRELEREAFAKARERRRARVQRGRRLELGWWRSQLRAA